MQEQLQYVTDKYTLTEEGFNRAIRSTLVPIQDPAKKQEHEKNLLELLNSMTGHTVIARAMIGKSMDSTEFRNNTTNMAITYDPNDAIAKAIRAALEKANQPAAKVDASKVQILGLPGSGAEGVQAQIMSMLAHANAEPKTASKGPGAGK